MNHYTVTITVEIEASNAEAAEQAVIKHIELGEIDGWEIETEKQA